MASVQAASAGQQPVPSFPLNMTTQEMQNVFLTYKHLKDTGASETSPEFIKVHQALTAIKQNAIYQKQRQAYAAHQHSAQQQNAVNNGVNGANGAHPTPLSSSPPSTQASTSTSLGPSTIPAPASNQAVPKGAIPRTAPASGGYFLPEQLSTLKLQIYAFKMLSKNLGIPQATQQQLFALKKMTPPVEQTLSAVSQTADGTDLSTANKALEAKKPHEYSKALSPFIGLKDKIDYVAHRDDRTRIAALEPVGVNFEKLRAERQQIVYNRMQARLAELKSIPVNVAHLDVRDNEIVPEDTLKRKALIEMKMLGLYAKQKMMREKLGRHMVQYDNLAMTANRSTYRRTKKQSLREARVTEKLEKQQRDARETREKKRHAEYIQAALKHTEDVKAAANNQKAKLQKLGQMMKNQHQNIEKEEQKRIERTAKQRLQALKSNDEEAYLKLLDQAKDTRITHLLRQTDGFLTQLAASVKAQQRKAAERYGEDMEDFIDEESEAEDEEDAADVTDVKKIDYYAVAHRIKEEVTVQPSILVGGTLKEYQLKGLQWMISLYNNNLNGILADEMGLGKTIQTISLITHLIEKKKQNGPFLVIVPLSTLTNWNLEFEKWAPSISRVVYKGPPNARKQQQAQIRYGQFQVLLTTYEYIIKDRPILSKIKWIHMIIDEGHRMKNAQSKLSATLSQYYVTRYRIILTGTPLQNNLPELWALLNFVLPTIFKSVKSFDEWFNTPFANTGGQDKMELTEEEQILVIRRLHKVLRPFLLRRLKKDVEKDLPDKTEKVIKCKFSALQTRLYKQMFTNNKLIHNGKGGKVAARGLSNMIMQLRKLCNHPFVFDEVENTMNPKNTSNDTLWRTAGKFELLDRILPKYKDTGHRVLMFFQMTAIMDIMEDFLRYKSINFLRLDGATKSDERSNLLADFNAKDSPYDVFLLSTRAGGLGLNLQTADTVIIYDSDWNPHQDLQAQDRAHRIGQKNEVRILRLISSNSVEEKILERARYKLDIDGKVIQAGRFDNKSSETDRDAMLRVMLDTADASESFEQEEMDDDELNEILARSEDELAIFRALDQKNASDPLYGTGPGCKPRLMAESELPEIYLGDGNLISDEVEEVTGRGARERTRVKYDDGLTEEQWLNAVDDDEDSPEAAAARKAARKARREQKRAGQYTGSIENSPAGSRESSEEIPEPTPKKGRKGKADKADKRKAEDLDDEPPAKRKRGGAVARPKASAPSGLSVKHRNILQSSLRNIYDALINLKSDSSAGSDDDDDEGPRPVIGPFIDKPSKKDFPQYYLIIKEPISMKMIEKKIKKEYYSSLNDLRKDIQLLCTNAKTFNEDGSIIFNDAITIENGFNSRLREEIDEHPELGDLDDSSRNGGSTAPTTSAGTPLPAPGGTKLKITYNNSQYANGGSGIPSDEED